MQFSAHSGYVQLGRLDPAVLSIDVQFDGARVWSLDRSEIDKGRIEWPSALRPYLIGHTRISLVDSATGRSLAKADVAFDEQDSRTVVADQDGLPLAVNKWGRLGKTLGGRDDAFQNRILTRTLEVVDVLERFGVQPFIVGGTLLGAVRDHALLPHDDDADVAYLSEYSTPADIALEGFRLGAFLEKSGYEFVRHSATHMQLQFRTSDGHIDYYVDVFTAFFTPDGYINQPFHVRGKMPRTEMLPFASASIDDFSFPAPANVDTWLTINYDENWSTPIPGFQIRTPKETRRRFQNWFGSFNFRREFWEEFHSEDRHRGWLSGGRWLTKKASSSSSAVVFDVGCGDGRLTIELAAVGSYRRVIGLDFSRAAIVAAERNASNTTVSDAAELEFAHANLYRTTSLTLARNAGVSEPFDVIFNHVLEQLGHLGRANAWRLIRMALRSGGQAFATVYTSPAVDLSFQNPTTWHLDLDDLRSEASHYGIAFSNEKLTGSLENRDELGRHPVGLDFFISTSIRHDPPSEEKSMTSRVRQALKRIAIRPSRREIEEAQEQIAALRNEIDELRRDHLRVAELLDIAEQRLTPTQNSSASTRERE